MCEYKWGGETTSVAANNKKLFGLGTDVVVAVGLKSTSGHLQNVLPYAESLATICLLYN